MMNINNKNNVFSAINFGVGEQKQKEVKQEAEVSSVDALKFLDRNQKINNPFSTGLYDRIESSVSNFQSLNILS